MAHPPAHTQILVVGGGPSGSYAASTLAREGFQVVLFEAASFPRYHVGESLIPAVRHHLRFIDAEEKVVKAGFARKPGAAMKFTQHKHEGYTDFVAIGANNSVWNVKRADFDKLLLDHSGEQGASVFQQTKVTAIEFNDENRPVAATYTSGSETPADDDAPQSQRKITFDYLIDASGRAGIMSTRYLKTRKFNSALRNIATWGYWRNAGIYGKGTRAEGAAWFEALTDESGWAWFIPLAGGLASVGLVRAMKSPPPPSSATNRFTNPPFAPQTPPAANATAGAPSTPQGRTSPDSPGSVQSSGSSNAPSTAPTTPATANEPKTPPSASRSPNDGSSSTTRQRYLAGLSLAPGLLELLGPGAEMMVGDSDIVSSDDVAVRSTSDFSYSATSYAGPGYRIVGDAGAFIDPFFSSGIHLAMNSALSASASVAAIIRGDCTEDEAAEWHSARVSTSYTRFLVVVLSAYKQMRSQKEEVLTDVGEESFDNAFKALRPVIHGNADVGPRLSEQEVQQTLDFCSDLFTPTSPEQHAALQARVAASEKMAQQSASNPDDQAPQAEDTPSTNGEGKQTGTIDRMLQWLRVSEPTSPGDNGVASSLRSRAAATAPGLTDKLFNIRAPVLAPRELDEAVASLLPAADIGTPAEEEARRVLSKINARRVIHRDFGGMHSLEEEALGAGLSVRLERGRLGLLRTKTDVPGSATA